MRIPRDCRAVKTLLSSACCIGFTSYCLKNIANLGKIKLTSGERNGDRHIEHAFAPHFDRGTGGGRRP
jgi:hypothetical protein